MVEPVQKDVHLDRGPVRKLRQPVPARGNVAVPPIRHVAPEGPPRDVVQSPGPHEVLLHFE
eukprot:9227590-Pyramimonas_sp.AAC.1